jgi:sulfur-oxidizing protein SoxB
MSYPEVYVQTMTGAQIKAVMEDVCDNLFNADPYYQQGGDMVRVGGLTYACAPNEAAGNRISDITLADGRAIEASKDYRVAGWASVNEQQGAPVWDVVSTFLQSGKYREARRDAGVVLKGVEGNPGLGGAE